MKCAVLLILLALAAVAPAGAAASVSVPHRASLVLVGGRPADRAGAAVARAGDVNGDGHGDIVVGAPGAGAAYVVLGPLPHGRLTLGRHGFRIAGTDAGAIVAGAGDVNGDGLGDLIVSGRNAALESGVFVVFGKRDRAPVDLAALGGGGYFIAVEEFPMTGAWPVGDVNGDGRPDLGIGGFVDGDEFGGSLRIVYGRSDPAAPQTGFLVRGDNDDLRLGSAAASAGDVNHDGFGDVLIGAPGARFRRGGPQRGAVFVLHGTRQRGDLFIRSGDRFPGRQLSGPPGARGFGTSVARYGNGIVAGAPGTVRSTRPGSAWIVAGHRTVRLAGPRTGGPVGLAVAVRGRQVLTLARSGKALLFSAGGRRLRTYTGLRNARRTRCSIAVAGRTLLFGSPGANAAYVLTRP